MRATRVLLADDCLMNQAAFAGPLTRQGYDVTLARNGREAVATYLGGMFDVVLMDVEMPVMDGLTAARLIRHLEADGPRRVPIIALASSAHRDACLQAGMDAHLEKPVPLAVLQEALYRVLQR